LVTVVQPGNLSLDLEIKAQANGITVTGASDIILEQQQDRASQASVLVNDVNESARSHRRGRPCHHLRRWWLRSGSSVS